jgi:hypothetical protein
LAALVHEFLPEVNMKKLFGLLALALLPASGQQPATGPLSHSPVVDIKGTIKQVHIEKGAGMPWLDVETSKGPVKLMLGSMRYLMQNDFAPKAGDAITAKAFQQPDQTIAMSVELPGSGKSLKLRDDKGMPVWRGGMSKGGMKGGGRHGNQPAKETPKA